MKTPKTELTLETCDKIINKVKEKKRKRFEQFLKDMKEMGFVQCSGNTKDSMEIIFNESDGQLIKFYFIDSTTF